MKNNPANLDVDYIGGQEPLTQDEKKSLSTFFQERKHTKKIKKKQTISKKRIFATV